MKRQTIEDTNPLMVLDWTEVQFDPNNTLGQGSFGCVYKATCRGSTVALKVLKARSRAVNLVEIRNEIEVLSKLKHQNVVVWMGLVKGGEKYGILMSLEKWSLKDVLYKMGPLEALKKWKYSIDICRGMCWLDSHNIFHRDLKPDNILISEAGDCKITDFGLSKILEPSEFVSDRTGSFLWMAPEVLQKGIINNKADVYSFALIVWQIFTQSKLYTEVPDDAFRDLIIAGHRPSVSSLPGTLQAILNESWHPDPQVRPTFPALLLRLEEALHEAYLKEFPCGLQFWAKHFQGMVFVPWTEFFNKLKDNCTCASSLDEDLLKQYFGVVDNTPVVSIQRFRYFLGWFEDLEVLSSEPRILQPFQVLSDALKSGWLGGIIDHEVASSRLMLVHSKVFIIRVNAGLTGKDPFEYPFVLCTKQATTAGAILQSRISYDANSKEFKVVIHNKTYVEKRVPITKLIPILESRADIGDPVETPGKKTTPTPSFYT